MTTDSLSIYAIKRTVNGQRIDDFDHVIKPDRLDIVDETRDFQSPQAPYPPWTARMYLWQGEARRPSWVDFLEEGFGGDRIEVTGTAQDCAVVVVKVLYRVERLYAIPFGLSGRFQIRRDVFDPQYGLRVALNLLYEGDMDAEELNAAPRIHQVESKTVAAHTMRTIRQANRRTEFEDFELNSDTDQLSGITGQPRDTGLARRVRGTDSLRVARRTDFDQLGHLCRSIARAHGRSDYRRRFQFVDQHHGITDPNKIARLTDRLCVSLRADPSAWTFSIPSVHDFDRLAAVRVTTPSGNTRDFVDPTTRDIADWIGVDNLVDHLLAIQVETIDTGGNVTDRWSMHDCLDGQIVTSGDTFLIETGTFYQIEPDYLAKLDQDVDAIPDSSVALPPSERVWVDGNLKEIDEGTYNIRASDPADHLLLDRKTVIVPGKTSPIEVCDVLTRDRQLVHVKRKFSSSALSHLFAQGYVSAELLIDSETYRARVRAKIGSTHPNFQSLFPEEDVVVAAEWEVVYAIIGPWNSGSPSARLPFFSKVNLREYVRRLRRMGFKVTLARVPVMDP